MSGGRWPRVREILERALEKSPADRAAFLDAACGADRTLRLDVESLLEGADDQAFLEHAPVSSIARAFQAATHSPPRARTTELDVASLAAHTTLCIRTGRTLYRMTVLDPAERRVTVQGGRFAAPTEARLLRDGRIRCGLRLALAGGDLEMVTAPVQAIEIEGQLS